MAKDGYKKVPSFWWDFEWDDKSKTMTSVVVESDHPRYPIIAIFLRNEEAIGDWEVWTNAVSDAEKLINDLYAGRVTIKQVTEKYL